MSDCVKKKYFSDKENLTDFRSYIEINKKALKNKINQIPNPRDYPNSMKDGRLYEKFSIEYIKNILFKDNTFSLSENVPFNFYEYVKLFTETEHSAEQNKIFKEIIGLKDQKAQSDDYMYFGDFDMVIDSISGKVIKDAMDKFKYNIFEYSKDLINKNEEYCVIGEIKKDFFKDVKKDEIVKQFLKYAKILKLLSTEPNLKNIKKKIGINENKKILFAVVTDGNFYNFDYMRYRMKKFREDAHSDKDIKSFPDFGNLGIISADIPVIIIFVPRTLDDNKGIFVSKGENKIISELKDELKSLKKEMQAQINELKSDKKEMQAQINELLGRKRKDNDDNVEREEDKKSKGEEKKKERKEEEEEKKKKKIKTPKK